MTIKRIAIIGSCDPTREGDFALDSANSQFTNQAGEHIGYALAEQDYAIDVYSSAEHMFEVDVVRGFAKSEKAKRNSIRVLFSSGQEPPRFAEQTERSSLFDPEPDPGNTENWEVSFYASIADVDGVILLGGGNSTLIAGLVALGHSKPIVALGMFGGAARRVWKVLGVHENYVPRRYLLKDDWDKMGYSAWSSDIASDLIDALGQQFKVREDLLNESTLANENMIAETILRVRAEYENIEIRRKRARLYSLITIPLFVGIFVLWAISQSVDTLSVPALYGILVFCALAGGIVGSSIRVVLNEFQRKYDTQIPDFLQSLVLGLISGGVAAAMFITAQTASLNSLDLSLAEQVKQLKPLVLNTAIIGVFGGVGLEAVFSSIQSSQPLEPSSYLPSGAIINRPNADNR